MKNLIIEAGKKLGEQYRTQLGGQMTDASSKKLCAMATDLLIGAQYDQARMLLAICDRYHVLTKYCASNIDWTIRAQEALNTLVSGAMLANNFAVYATALVVMICDGEAEGEKHALELIASGGVPKTVAPQPTQPVPQPTQPQPTQPQPTQPQPTQPQPIFPQPTPPQVNWADFDISGDTLVAYKGSQKYVTVPDGITKIGDKAFYGNINVENVTIPEGVVSIGAGAFGECRRLNYVQMPNTVTDIGEGAFIGCTGMMSLGISSGITAIAANTYDEHIKLNYRDVFIVDRVVVGTNVASDSYFESRETAYRPRNGSMNIVIPDGVTAIGKNAFRQRSLIGYVNIPEGVVSIEEDAFCGCTSLSSITLPDSVKTIGLRAFEGCTSIVSVSIGSGVTSIDRFAFNGCKKLKSLVIPENVTKIGSCAFQGCTGLEAITVSGNAFDDGMQSKPLGYIFGFEASGCIEVKQRWYSYTSGNSDTSSYYIPKSLKSVTIKGRKVPFGFLSRCTEIKSVTISGGITSIEDTAFAGCIGLTEIVIPDTVKRIGKFSFCACRNLTSLELPSSVDSIGDRSFAECFGLATVVINSGLKTIGQKAFDECTGLESITIPKSVKKIGADAFRGCKRLTIYKEGGLALWDLFGASWNPEKRPVEKV